MAEIIQVMRQTPKPRRIERIAQALKQGAVIAYPTDSSYGLACAMGNKEGIKRISQIRQFGKRHFFTLLCRDLSEIAKYAQVDNANYRLLKSTTPGAYTFVLPASREVPRWIQQPKRKTIGIRISSHPVAHAIVDALDEPFMTVTAQAPEDDLPLTDALDVKEAFDNQIDYIVDAGATGIEPTTVVDLTGAVPEIIRQGVGSAQALGLTGT